MMSPDIDEYGVYEYDYDVTPHDDDTRIPHDVIFGIGLSLGVLTSLLLLILLVLIVWRRQTSRPFFIVLTSWSFATLIYLAVFGVYEYAAYDYTWKFGEFACRSLYYLRRSLAFTRAYLMVLAALVNALGHHRLQEWTKTRPLAQIVIPVIASSLIWIMVFLPCMQYWHGAKYMEVGVVRKGYWCILSNGWGAQAAEFILQCILPYVLSAGLLLVWACLLKSKMADRMEKVQGIILLIILHTYMAVQFFVLGVPLLSVGSPVLRVLGYISLCEYALCPAFCLALMLVYRRVFCGSEQSEPKKERRDTGKDTEL